VLALQHGLMPAGLNVQQPDPALQSHYLLQPRHAPLRLVASNSFGFGGSNCCLLFGAAPHEARCRRGGIGAAGPGLADWAAPAPLLRDPSAWQRQPTVVPAPARLPATERRRAGTGGQGVGGSGRPGLRRRRRGPGRLATVFTSSTGDPANCHAMCEALARPDRLVSPTRFTNSVHNVAAGYWHIATQAMRRPPAWAPSTPASPPACWKPARNACTAAPVLLVACDVPYPEPLHGVRPLPDTLAVALVLVPQGRPRLAWRWPVTPRPRAARTKAWRALRTQIPAARALPLLQALAGAGAATLVIEGLPARRWRCRSDAA
jgi:hypothetical protein